MAVQRTKSRAFGSCEQTLMGIGVIGLCAALSREAGAALSHLWFHLAEQLVKVLVCLLIGEGRLLAAHALDFQRLLDCYCALESVAPLFHCLFGMR